MNQDELKRQAAEKALEFLPDGGVLGIGTGSTVNHFIDLLAPHKGKFDGAVSSSEASTERLKAIGMQVLDLNSTGDLEVYVDGADESNRQLHLIKGGGGALTREKIIAAASKKFVCIADESKLVSVLGTFPLPVEVIPMARSYIARELVKLGGRPVWREAFITDNGNVILDVHGLEIMEPMKLEAELNGIVGVVTNGLFARRPADVLLVAGEAGVDIIFAPSVDEMYGAPAGVTVRSGSRAAGLCGASRPGHFDGVASVVLRLLNIVGPDMCVLGRKDYQQLMIIERMIADLRLPVAVISGETQREDDGLAISSRNLYLSREERRTAPLLHATLQQVGARLAAGERDYAALQNDAAATLDDSGFKTDYFEIRVADDLGRPNGRHAPSELIVLAAAWLGRARLIDNFAVDT